MTAPEQNSEFLALLNLWAPVIVITLVLLSYALHKIKKTPHPMTLKETGANLSIFVIWKFFFFSAGAALHLLAFTWIRQWIPWTAPSGLVGFLLCLLVVDFLYYWKHRCEHRVSLLWPQHHVHHSSVEFNFSTSLRLPWVGSYFVWIFLTPAIFLGFNALQVIAAYQVLLAYQYLVHTEMVPRLGWVEKVLNTPSNHRVHHGRNEKYLDKNYGGILIIWDRLFGTYEAEVEEVDYGTVDRLESYNPITINLKPWINLWKEVKLLPPKKSKVKALFRSPGDLH